MKGMRQNGRRGQESGARRGAARPALLVAALLLAVAVPPAMGLAAPSSTRDVAATSAEQWTNYENQPLRVNIWRADGSDEVCRRGEVVSIAFEANQDAYAVVYRIDADGEVTILWPRSRYDDGFVFGRHEYVLPASGEARLRAGPNEGVEYVQAIVSLYPFDLRELEVDFHHEAIDNPYHYAVAGDPFLAMNEVNYAVTRLENPEDFVVTNYVNWYVEREVEHPRYLCAQCHNGDVGYDPYRDSCVIAIHHDYSWENSWYVRFGYYPIYYYPAYYYVDPWSWRPWINYWYTPWYAWPTVSVYNWPYAPYDWYYSSYWDGDCWDRYNAGDRRYVPLDKYASRDRLDRTGLRDRSTLLVKSPRPPREVTGALESKMALDRDGVLVRNGRVAEGQRSPYQDVAPAQRGKTEFRDQTPRAPRPSGLRVRDDGTGARGSRVLPAGTGGSSRTPVRRSESGFTPTRPTSDRAGAERGGIRPIQPRKPGARIWSGSRSGSTPEREARPAPAQRVTPSGQQDRTRDRNSGAQRQPEQARPKSESKSKGDERPPAVQPPPDRGASRPAPAAPAARDPGRSAPSRPTGGDTRGRGQREDGGR